MRTFPFPPIRAFLPLLGLSLLSLTACKKDSEPATPAVGDGTVTWTTGGVTSTSTIRSSAIMDTGDAILVTGSTEESNGGVSLLLAGINAKGVGTYDLRKGSLLDNFPAGILTLKGSTASQTRIFNTLFGPTASNGTVVVTQYDKAGQKLSGTFSFTAGAVPNTPATGTQAVTNGTFSFSRFR